ncbi:unnamed protein product [Sphagnum balticum]
MPPNVQSPVHIHKPVAVPDGVNGKGVSSGGFSIMCRRQVGRRRIFVQTDTGNVLGIELDRADKVESVKKKVQAAFCVPTEQSDLVFGDLVLDKDLSGVRNDSPLLLTRNLYRSSSTPCLSPTIADVKSNKDFGQNRLFEIVGGSTCCSKINRLLREAAKAAEAGVDPVPAGGGLGGAYYFRNCRGESIAIVKPTDEEPFAPNNPKGFTGRALGQPGLKRSIRVGETGVREVAAYLLDHDHFAKVPATALVKAIHPIFNVNWGNAVMIGGVPSLDSAKIGSFQQFVSHDFDASEHGTSRFPVSSVHRIGILDIRLFNTDRHAGNILVKKLGTDAGGGESTSNCWPCSGLRVEESVELIPIDHGLCLPETLDDPYFEWLHWPQASFPFSDEEIAYIERLDPMRDAEMLRRELPTLREACIRMLVLSTIFLKKGTAAGLSLADIAGMMSRELCGVDEDASELENLCMQAKAEVDEELLAWSSESDNMSLQEVSLSEDLPGQPFLIEMDDHEEELRAWSSTDNSQWLFQPPVTGYAPLSPLSPSRISQFRGGLASLMLQELHPLETTAVPLSPLCTPEQHESTSLFNSVESSALSQISGPVRSISFSNTKCRSHTQIEQRRSLGLQGIAPLNVAQNVVQTPGFTMGPLILADMSEKAWTLFLEFFQQLLPAAFTRRKSKGMNQFQRLGTSCRF